MCVMLLKVCCCVLTVTRDGGGLVGWFRHGLFRGFLLLESFSTMGSVVRFLDAVSQSVCDHCGANIYANDVFKKIKDLIG
jgi:hypothetical protein